MHDRETSFVQSKELELFRYDNNHIDTLLTISARHEHYRKRADYTEYKGSITKHHVSFCFCSVSFDNNYMALNRVSAALKVFEKRQFSNRTQGINLRMEAEMFEHVYVFSRIAKANNDKKIVEIGLTNKVTGALLSHFMHIGYVHAFQSALVKAMQWVSPQYG